MKHVFWIGLFFFNLLFAASTPGTFSYQGRLFKSNGVDPVNSSTVQFSIQLRSPDGACLLFEETHFRNLSNTDGTFALIIGEGTNTNATALSLFNVMDNSLISKTGASCNYSPAAGDFRRLRLTYNDGVETTTLAPDQTVRSVPYAMIASSLEGLRKNQFLQISNQVTQSKAETVFASYGALIDLLNGTSTAYALPSDSRIVGALQSSATAGGDLSGTNGSPTVSKLRGIAVSAAAPTSGQILKYNSTASRWEPSTDDIGSGTVTGVTSSSPLIVTGSTAPIISLQAGTSVGQYMRWNGTSWSSSFANLTELRGVSSAQQLPTTCGSAQVWGYQSISDTFSCLNILILPSQVSGLGGAAILNVGTGLGSVAAGNDSRLVGAIQSGTSLTGDLSGTFASPTVSKILGVPVSTATPTNGQVLKYNVTGNQWEASTDSVGSGTVTSVSSGTGLTGGTITSSGTLAVDVGTSANKIVQLDSTGRLPAVDGSQLTGMSSAPFKNLQIFSTDGASTWTVPAGVTKIFVEVWGAGGGGAGGKISLPGGMGGGAGAYGAWFQSVTPGAVINLTVGAGGSGGATDSAGNAGATSVFNGTVVNGGSGATLTIVGGGGAAPIGLSIIGMSGSAGSFGSIQSFQTNLVTVVGITVMGSTDLAGLGGAGGTAARGGAGGSGSGSSSLVGSVGVIPGGGGGGGGSSTNSIGSSGGSGASGRIIIWH